MSLLSRRGFLQTLATAAVGAAVFDPKSLLWVPAPAQSTIVLAEASPGVIAIQLELNDLAQRFARLMSERLLSSRSTRENVALKQIMFRHAGHVHLPAGSLEVDDLGAGYFSAEPARLVRGGVMGRSTETFLHDVAADIKGDIARRQVDMFAPIAADLRPNEPFTDVAIGLGTDPESGLSARVLRYRQPGVGVMTEVEMAGGTWRTHRSQQATCPTCHLRGHRLGEDAYFCPSCNEEWKS